MIMADPSVWHLDTGEVILRTGLAVVFEGITGFGAGTGSSCTAGLTTLMVWVCKTTATAKWIG